MPVPCTRVPGPGSVRSPDGAALGTGGAGDAARPLRAPHEFT